MPYIFETIFSKRKDVNMNYLLGVDLGTSGTKTVLFDEDGNVVASKTIEYPLYQEKNGWAEQEPLDWWNAAADTIHAVITESGVDNKDIKGLGISGQMHGLVMLDKDGNVVDLKEDEDALDTFNLSRMDADDDRHRNVAEDAEFEASGFEFEDAPEDAGADVDVDFDDE